MGYFEIGVYHPRSSDNIGTLWRTAYQLGAAGIFTIGRPYRQQTSDTQHASYEIPLRNFPTFDMFLANRPVGAQLIGVEMGGEPLAGYIHPERAVYLLGSEANGLPAMVLQQCNAVVTLEHVRYASYNLAVAGSIVLYHRLVMSANPGTSSG